MLFRWAALSAALASRGRSAAAASLLPASICSRISLTTRLIAAFRARFNPRRFSLCRSRFAAEAIFGIATTSSLLFVLVLQIGTAKRCHAWYRGRDRESSRRSRVPPLARCPPCGMELVRSARRDRCPGGTPRVDATPSSRPLRSIPLGAGVCQTVGRPLE